MFQRRRGGEEMIGKVVDEMVAGKVSGGIVDFDESARSRRTALKDHRSGNVKIAQRVPVALSQRGHFEFVAQNVFQERHERSVCLHDDVPRNGAVRQHIVWLLFGTEKLCCIFIEAYHKHIRLALALCSHVSP